PEPHAGQTTSLPGSSASSMGLWQWGHMRCTDVAPLPAIRFLRTSSYRGARSKVTHDVPALARPQRLPGRPGDAVADETRAAVAHHDIHAAGMPAAGGED